MQEPQLATSYSRFLLGNTEQMNFFVETRINVLILIIKGAKLNEITGSSAQQPLKDLLVNGHMTKKLYEIYEDLAKGGVGTIITGLTFVSDLENVYPGQTGIYDDTFINEYRNLTGMVHRYSASIIMQLACNGSQTPVDPDSGKAVWGPSAVEDLAYKNTPQEMTKEEIIFVQKAFADAAERAKKAGFDGVQMHAAHGYLLSKFLTPYYNRRTDQYGGDYEKRSRMVLETYEAIRDRVGPDYPVFIKINSEDFFEQGMTFSDCRHVCRKLADLGIDAI